MSKIVAAVITVSDSRREADDVSGNRLSELVAQVGDVAEKLIVTDDLEGLRTKLCDLADRDNINLIVTTGGTGVGPRDNTPEATQSVIERGVPGMAEAMRAMTLKNTPMAMLSRGICGIRNDTLIINLPGSPKAVEECFEVLRPVLQHAVSQVSGNTDHEKTN